MKQAVFFDIDGTLAIRRFIPPSAETAVRSLRENGTLVFICTGRNASYVRHHFHAYADGFICATGRYALYNGRILYDHPIELTLLQKAREITLGSGGGITFFGNRNAYYEGDAEGFEKFREAHAGQPLRRLITLEQTDPIYTFDVFFHSEEELQCIRSSLRDFCIFNPHLPWPTADVTVLPYDKGTALTAVCQALGIRKEDSFAFGDGENDLCMFKAAGHGIAMGNAAASLKECADHVTDSILEDGVLHGLNHYGLL